MDWLEAGRPQLDSGDVSVRFCGVNQARDWRAQRGPLSEVKGGETKGKQHLEESEWAAASPVPSRSILNH